MRSLQAATCILVAVTLCPPIHECMPQHMPAFSCTLTKPPPQNVRQIIIYLELKHDFIIATFHLYQRHSFWYIGIYMRFTIMYVVCTVYVMVFQDFCSLSMPVEYVRMRVH